SSLLTGLRKGIVTFFQEFGPNNIFVSRYTGDPNAPPRRTEVRRRPLLPGYADVIRRLAPSVDDVALQLMIPSVNRGQPVPARVPGFESDNVNIGACNPTQLRISPREVAQGRIFTDNEDARAAKVGILGSSLAAVLFPDGKALGRGVIVSGAEYTVIGV